MNAKDFLEQPKKIDKMIENKLSEKEQWKAIAESTTSHSDGERVQSSGSKQKMADAVGRFIDLEKEVDQCLDDLIDAKKDVISVIEQLKVKEYDILHKMYIGIPKLLKTSEGVRKVTEYKTLDEVAWMYGKSRSWAKGNHRSALVNVQRILDKRQNES